MEVQMEASPISFDPEDLSIRQRFRRYGKKHSPSSLATRPAKSATRLSEIRSNSAVLMESIRHEVESIDNDRTTPLKMQHDPKWRSSPESHGVSRVDVSSQSGNLSITTCKQEHEAVEDNEGTTFYLFASLLDSALKGSMSLPELVLQFESSCRNVSESIRFGSSEHHTIGEDKLMKQRSKLLLDEAASWSLLWYLYGKGNDELPNDLIMFPTTSHLEACQFVNGNLTAQLCLRIVQWLEGLASKALDFENKKQDESLLEDVWTFLRAGRLEEACNLCRSAGQPWRAATLSPFGRLDQKPSIEALIKNGKTRALQAIELETGIGHQRRLWKWACYCASERIAEQDGGKYEIAVYAAQCSNLKRILPMCTNWEDIRRNESLLYLWYAEVELANCSQDGSESLLRALHILSCLGSGMKYTPYKCHRPSLMQLKARQGFRERLKMLHSSWSRGVIDDQSVSLVCCAALFEEISTGWTASAEIFDEAFSRVLPERRRNSHHLEFLFNYYLNMLSKHLSEVKLSKRNHQSLIGSSH